MIFYRYQDEPLFEGGVRIEEKNFVLIRETPCGYWIFPGYILNYLQENSPFSGEMVKKYKKWVSKTSIKRYAYPTKRAALENLAARKRRQIDHTTYFLDRAKKALFFAEIMLEKESTE